MLKLTSNENALAYLIAIFWNDNLFAELQSRTQNFYTTELILEKCFEEFFHFPSTLERGT
jgi:hypothetical protein